jgi:agmatine deiminase
MVEVQCPALRTTGGLPQGSFMSREPGSDTTPRQDGLSMPAEFGEHQACLVAWPTTTRKEFWGEFFEAAKDDYASVARAIVAFEPVTMICEPGRAAEVRNRCGSEVDVLELPIDDSWIRDNGPIFVTDGAGGIAIVDFRFNAWGEKYPPWDKDADVTARLAAHFGMRRYATDFVLEGGSFFVDGEGTLLTTEQCLLHPNRNPGLTREDIEWHLHEYLGVETVIWLQAFEDRDTDGHVDGIAQVVRPGTIVLEMPTDPSNHNFEHAKRNAELLGEVKDARRRTIEVLGLEPTAWVRVGSLCVEIPYANFYLPDGGVIVPTGDVPQDDEAIERLSEIFPDRTVVPVPGALLEFGGGGPHCITQQIPVPSTLAG